MRMGRLSSAIGILQGDVVGMAQIINAAQTRLITAPELGETGWWGSWARTVFNVLQSAPHITLPRTIARVINVDVCKHPIAIQNEFYEFMQFGIGKQPNHHNRTGCGIGKQMFDRGTYPSFVDLPPTNNFVRVYLTTGADGGQRTLIQGLDVNGEKIYSQDGYNQVDGLFLSMEAPFVDCPQQMSRLTGIQKDITSGPVQYFTVDATTGVETAILTMDPGETVAGYRRYYLNGLPANCCSGGSAQPIQVEGMAKLELIPVVVDTDYLLIQNPEAIIAECKSIRYGDMDSAAGKSMSEAHHKEAIRLLQGEIIHYLGKEQPAVVYEPFGSARLERVKIGMM
jgi:hypothetical protein